MIHFRWDLQKLYTIDESGGQTLKIQNPKIFEIFDNDTFCTLCLPNPSLIQIMLIHTRRWTIWGKVRKIVAESESGFFLPLTRDNVSK